MKYLRVTRSMIHSWNHNSRVEYSKRHVRDVKKNVTIPRGRGTSNEIRILPNDACTSHLDAFHFTVNYANRIRSIFPFCSTVSDFYRQTLEAERRSIRLSWDKNMEDEEARLDERSIKPGGSYLFPAFSTWKINWVSRADSTRDN